MAMSLVATPVSRLAQNRTSDRRTEYSSPTGESSRLAHLQAKSLSHVEHVWAGVDKPRRRPNKCPSSPGTPLLVQTGYTTAPWSDRAISRSSP